MQSQCLRIFGLLLGWKLTACTAQPENPTYVEIEGVKLKNECNEELYGSSKHGQLACDGQRKLSSGEFAEAAKLFEEAMTAPIFEVPNVDLYSKLALARHLAGDREGAEKSLQAARLAYAVELQVDYARDISTPRCPIHNDVTPWPGDEWIALNERLGSELVDQVLAEVCSEGNSGIGPGLEGIWAFGPNLQEYFAVKSYIEGGIGSFFDGE